MLSKQALSLIKASVPLLRESGEVITRLFYKNMFSAHPELKHIFNVTNQENGSQQQALAGAVYAYAANITNPEALSPVLSRIAHKHASLGIKPAQYTIVGKYLLAAIKTSLGELASEEIMAAWDEAYWLLACELIALEAQLYSKQNLDSNNCWQQMKIIEIKQEAKGICSLYLQTLSGQVKPFIPGQYVSVAADLNDLGLQQIRQYSLSDAPNQNYWRITIKHEQGNKHQTDGHISSYLHQCKIGDNIKVSAAYGDFTINQNNKLSNEQSNEENNEKPIVLISAGVGITPMVSMLNQLRENNPEQPIRFIHAAKSVDHQAFKDDLQAAKRSLTNYEQKLFIEQIDKTEDSSEQHQGYMSLEAISDSILLDDADYYLCGPIAFMQIQRKALLNMGVAIEKIKYEVFGPDLLLGLD